MLRHHLRRALFGAVQATCITLLIAAPASTTVAAEAAANSVTATYQFSIPAGSLVQALTAFAELTNANVAYAPELVRGLRTSGVSGEQTAEQALRQLLEGTGLGHRYVRDNAFTIEKLPVAAGTRTLGPVRVEGMDGTRTAGVNGSTDPTATEGTKSYTSSALTIGSKAPQSIKDTPQSVSVITQQRMQDQNLIDFAGAMNQATGVTLITPPDGPLVPQFYARGFEIRNIQIDGSAPLNYGFNFAPIIDMAMYDHVELLRGAAGLFNGYGDPGGTVNLVRKRPLDHSQVLIDGHVGSWSQHRAALDATAPLGFDGKLRGRAVTTYQDNKYFYDTADNNRTLIYGMLEADVTPSTLVSAGFSLTRQDAVVWYGGLPRFENGDDLKLSRDTCLCFPWNRNEFESNEGFLELEQRLGPDWSVKLNVGRSDQETHLKHAYVSNPVNPATLTGPELGGGVEDTDNEQIHADLTLTGAFELFGQRQEIVLGGNYQHVDGGGYKTRLALYSAPYPAVDVVNFDPDDLAFVEPASTPAKYLYPEWGQTQWGAYANVRLTPFESLHFNTGLRYSSYKYEYHQQRLDETTGQVIPGFLEYREAYRGNDLSWPPSYSLVYDGGENWSVYASYADIYVSQATYLQRSGTPVEPLTGSNIEAGVKLQSRDGKLNAALAAYRIEQKNYYQFVDYGPYESTSGRTPDGLHYCCFDNSNNKVQLSQGVDAEVSGEVLPGWQLFAGYTWNTNEIRGSDYYGADYAGPKEPIVSRSPEHLFKLWTGYQFQRAGWLRPLNVSAGVNAQTKSYKAGSVCTAYTHGTDANGEPTATCNTYTSYHFTQGFHAVFSARVGYQFDPRWNVALSINNLTDRIYYQTVGTSEDGNWYGEPRNFMLTVRGSF